jgi:hypothetical protein
VLWGRGRWSRASNGTSLSAYFINKLALKRLRASAKRRVGCKRLVGRDDQVTIHLVYRANEADFLDLAAVNRPLAVLISSPTSPLSALT